MGIDLASVFSRSFIVGFYVPSFVAGLLLDKVATKEFLPLAYRQESAGTRILILAGVALVAGLFLSGLAQPILRLFEGYPFHNAKDGSWRQKLAARSEKKWRVRFDSLELTRKQKVASEARTRAALERYRQFPAESKHILPTRFGNVLRSFETHPRQRYGLDGIAVWPRVEALLSDGERQSLEDALGTVSFFVNSCVLAVVTGALLAGDSIANMGGAHQWVRAALISAVALAVAAMAYRWSIGAVERWGLAVRSAFDLHRFDLYEKLGCKAPLTGADENALAQVINRCLLFAEPIPDEWRKPPALDAADQKASE
jgi:hypothetical protein